MSSALRVMVGILGGLLCVALVGVLGLSRATSGLTADLSSLSAWASPIESRILDASGAERATFRLVEASSWPGGDNDELVEAFLAASPPSFYEPRALAATSLGPALQRVLGGAAPPASPLSIELARWMLSSEPPGPARRLREDILSTSLDARVALSRRVVAWMDRVPLCLGRRGLERAARVCLGRPLDTLTLGERVTLAAAASARLDLAADRDVLEARRGLVLDTLVVRGRLDGLEAAAETARGVAVPRPSGSSAWAELVALGPRHQLGRSNETRRVSVSTALDWPIQEQLAASLGEAGGFVVVRAEDGVVLAVGGDVLRPLGSPGGPTLLDMAAWAVGVIEGAALSGRVGDAAPARTLTWTRQVAMGEATARAGTLESGTLTPGRHPLLRRPPAEVLGVTSLAELPLRDSARVGEVLGARLALHERLALVWFGGDAPVGAVFEAHAGGEAFSRPEQFSWTP